MESARIKRVRKLLGMSQADISDLFGLSPATWNRYEMGHSTPCEWLARMLRVFEHVAVDPRVVGEFSALRENSVETPALIWFILDKAYRSRFTA